MRASLRTRVLGWRVRRAELFGPPKIRDSLVWAGVAGIVGGFSSALFREAITGLQRLLTGSAGDVVAAASSLAIAYRIAIPVLGGLLAGATLQFGARLFRGERAVDYMEAISLGDGVIRARPTLFKLLSSLFSIASGGSIGREGGMVQLSALLASWIGRRARLTKPQLRLMVACGGAAGIASAYNAPIAGALFMAEIVLGSIAMESFGPLVVASAMATLTVRHFIGAKPIFEAPSFDLRSSWEFIPLLGLGVFTGIAGPGFLVLLEKAKGAFERLGVPLVVKLGVGGLVVGILSTRAPGVWGNGHAVVDSILHSPWTWGALLFLFLGKIVATAATVGSGAVGGVFTPTLFVGGVMGFLFGMPLHALFPNHTAPPPAYALVGMGSFLAATTHAPIMAILMVFEMTLDYDVILPVMLAAVAAHTVSIGIHPRSIYSESLRQQKPESPEKPVSDWKVRDLLALNPIVVSDEARADEVADIFCRTRHTHIYVTNGQGRYLGSISLQDMKPFLTGPELAHLKAVHVFMEHDLPTLSPDADLARALELFARQDVERLPVVESGEGGRLLGTISKSDLLLTLAQRRGED